MSNDEQKRSRGPHQARIGIACPHCGGPTRVRSSRAWGLTAREMHLECKEISCAATFGAELSITHGILPSRNPRPDVGLRMTPPRRAAANDLAPAAANDDMRGPEVPRAANDDGLLDEANG